MRFISINGFMQIATARDLKINCASCILKSNDLIEDKFGGVNMPIISAKLYCEDEKIVEIDQHKLVDLFGDCPWIKLSRIADMEKEEFLVLNITNDQKHSDKGDYYPRRISKVFGSKQLKEDLKDSLREYENNKSGIHEAVKW